MEQSTTQVDSNVPNQQTLEPLPSVAFLREQFRAAIGDESDEYARIRVAFALAEELKETHNPAAGDPLSVIFFNSLVAVGNTKFADAYRKIAENKDFPASMRTKMNANRRQHLMRIIPSQKNIQAAMANLIINQPEVSAQTQYSRIVFAAENAASVLLGPQQSGFGKRIITGLATEHKILFGLRELGLAEARYSDASEEMREIDIVVPSFGPTALALQLKTIRERDILVMSRTKRGHPELGVGITKNPLNLSDRQKKILEWVLEHERAA